MDYFVERLSLGSTQRYLSVSQQDLPDDVDDVEKMSTSSTNSITDKNVQLYGLRKSHLSLWVAWLGVLCLLFSNLYTWAKLRTIKEHEAIFSPVTSVLKYKNVVWTAGVEDDKTPYQGHPNEENDRLWEELYNFGMTRIPLSDASQLTNRTTPIPGDPGYYVVTIDVFHELHCLNMMRKRIFWNETMGQLDDMYSLRHMDHCIDSLRQSLMCSSDITPIPYAWYPKYNQVLPTTGVTHTCRDFDAIKEWAKERYTSQMELKMHVEDPLGNVVYES